MKLHMPRMDLSRLTKAGEPGLNPDDINILMGFQARGSKTLGEIVSSSDTLGSRVIDTIDKLRDFGFIRRDWEREIEMGVDVVYSLTDFGRETIKRQSIKP